MIYLLLWLAFGALGTVFYIITRMTFLMMTEAKTGVPQPDVEPLALLVVGALFVVAGPVGFVIGIVLFWTEAKE